MNNTGYLLMNISKQLRYQLNDALKKTELTAQQWAVLQQITYLGALEKSVTAQKIASLLEMDKPTISGILKRLEQKELIIRKKDPKDSRSYQLHLTSRGQEEHLAAKKISDDVLQNFMSSLTQAEQLQLNELLQKLNKETS